MINTSSKKKKPAEKTSEDYQNLSLSNNSDVLLNDKLKESEIRYRRLFETAKDGILILNFETGHIVDANPFIVNIIDYPLEEILGKHLWEIGLFSNKKESEFAFIELKTKGYIRFEDMPIKSRNGKITQVEFISNVYVEHKTKVIQCNIRDITERKQAERKQELTIKILANLNGYDNWTRSIKNILGEIKNFTRMEAIAIRFKEDEEFPYFEAMGFPDYFIQAKKYLTRRDIKDEIIYDEKGNPYLECMCGNIVSGRTDNSLPYFTKGGSFYSNNTTGLPADVTEKGRQFEKCNQCNIEGFESVALIPLYSGKEIIGLLQLNDKRFGLLTIETIEFLEKIGNSIGIAYNRIQNKKKIKESEQNLKKQNAEFIELNKVYLKINEELTESIDHIKKINDELTIAKGKAEESDKLKSAFLANMSHEIRTPMNAIMGFSELLLEPNIKKENLEDFIQIINTSSQQLLTIIGDIIDISKIEAGLITINSELVNINILMNELFEIYNKKVESKKMTLYCSCERPNDLIQINTDGNRIKQVLCNLLNNAIKFTIDGKIEYGYKIKENFIAFYVKDTGVGIAQEHHDLIFQRFRQEKATLTCPNDGNGLGLAISKALVEKLGGTIGVNSELGVGSTFTFTIPYVKGVVNDVGSEKATIPIQIHSCKEETILIVEDDYNSQTYLKESLSSTNINLLHASNGNEAVEKVNNHSEISLVLMDIKMPIMNGYEAMRIIKQIRPKLPIIAQTAYALSNDKFKALEAGFDGYISKPINKNLLIKLVNGLLKE
ncbi:MAG: response regulator [Bacteroidales bacterium]|nr:MAG: response regulator [Bacteroidales bacterium]